MVCSQFNAGDKMKLPTMTEDGDSVSVCTAAERDGEVKECRVCGLQLGKRYFRPAYNCSICGRAVCSKCSPSSINLEGWPNPQRCCTPCAAFAHKGPIIKQRLATLGAQLHFLLGVDTSGTPMMNATVTIDDAVTYCQAAISPFQKKCESIEAYKRRAKKAEAGVEEVMEALVQERARAKTLEHELYLAEQKLAANQSKSQGLAEAKTVEKSSRPCSLLARNACFAVCVAIILGLLLTPASVPYRVEDHGFYP